MLNAVQNRMVEEALVDRQIYDAMLKMRGDIDAMIGHSAKGGTEKADGSKDPAPVAARSADRSPNGTPLPELPEAGRSRDAPASVTPSRRGATTASGMSIDIPSMASGAPIHVPEPSGQQTTAAGVPMDVMAVGDPSRDPDRPVAKYVPPTDPSSLSSDPFPQLGPKGKPLG